MQFSTVFFALAVASGAYAIDQFVKVGENGTLAFSPQSLNVQAGDNVIFQFLAKNHSVTQSSFAAPCSPLSGGVNSGFRAVNTTSQIPQWNITIQNTSAPFWFYCAQTIPIVHCHSGMVFAINPTAAKNFTTFQAAANNSASAAPGAPAASGTPPVLGAPAATSASQSVPTGAAPSQAGAQSSSSPTTATSTDGSAASGTSTSATANNGAARMGTSISGILALAGLVVGLMF